MSDIDWTALTRAASDARDRAYAPYSGYRVGAALLGEDGSVHVGANVENASYGLSLCAERAALAAAVVAGVRRFRGLVVVTGGPTPGTPCGMCRQALAELGPPFEVRCRTPEGAEVVTRVDALLPLPFRGP
ncbi:MAG: cytidine deaminase [Sandaracinaceae bacterium]